MNQEIFGLRYDFVYRHGHYMELYKEEGISQDELSGLQLRMLEANPIPNLLPLEVKEVDFRISLLYNLSSKRMLAHVLKVESFSKHHFVKILYAIVCTLEESRNYMLHENGYVLKDNFIFIGTDWSDVYLTYVPLHHEYEEISVLDSLESLKMHLADKVKEDDKRTFISWMESLSQNRNLSEYKQKLLTLMDDIAINKLVSAKLTDSRYEPSIESNLEMLSEVPEVPKVLPKEMQKVVFSEQESSLPKPLWSRNEDVVFFRGGISEEEGKNLTVRGAFSFFKISHRTQIIMLVVFLLSTAFLWQNYLTYPSTASLRITLGLTFLFADIWFVMKFKGVLWYHAVKSSPLYSAGEQHVENKWVEPQRFNPQNIQEHYQNLHMHTTLLGNSKPNITVFLGSKLKQMQGARLVVQRDGGNQTFALENNSFLIGRGDAEVKVDFVLDESGISRLHAEIFKDGDNFGIKDLGSTNGTFLNGEALVSYQAYPLQEGDVIRIIRSEMTFRVG
ncbi:DUF6382 domain-containing protein [Paenibacillus sedimenti]|uniref:DUF6382 domain-containing protein n=1 Tax=Paenibacillus sedimenti TaxID=2770274 RepID=UPI001CB6C044|nr:DUF6382 domain-containing protein [Paenibacillus sedimenti]